MKDLEERLSKALWKVEDFIREAEELLDKAHLLPPEKRKSLPKFAGIWKEKEVETYLQNLKETIEKPRIARSRKLLEEIGVSTEKIPKEALENTEEIEGITALFTEIKEELGDYINFLVKEGVLVKWLKEGVSETKERLQTLANVKIGLKRMVILESLDSNLKRSLLRKAIEDIDHIESYIERAEELNSQIGCIKEYEIKIEYRLEDLDNFLEKCKEVYETLVEFRDVHKLSFEEVKDWVRQKSLEEVYIFLGEKREQIRQENEKLKQRWKELADILREQGPRPEGLSLLRREIERLERKCKDTLGEPCLRLFQFLRGEADFPYDLSKEELADALKRLRPFISVSLSGERNANG